MRWFWFPALDALARPASPPGGRGCCLALPTADQESVDGARGAFPPPVRGRAREGLASCFDARPVPEAESSAVGAGRRQGGGRPTATPMALDRQKLWTILVLHAYCSTQWIIQVSKRAELGLGDIRRIREGLGLTQVEAGELLGGGPRAFTKYENGTIKPSASVANLLRLLDENPGALETLSGPRSVPIEDQGLGPLKVSADHIKALSSRKLALLVERLLASEAHSSGLPADGIHVAAQITVGDGGEDARIEWSGGPDRTGFIPNRLTQFQLKASSTRPAEAGNDVITSKGEVKTMVRDVLTNGGSYVMLVSHPAVKQTMQPHEAAIRKRLREAGLIFDDHQVSVRSAEQIALWVNSHPAAAAWILAQTQPGTVGPFRDWSHWAGRHEHDSSPWVVDDRLDRFRAELRELIMPPRGVARVVGRSGIGKSRLTLEALGRDAIEDMSGVGIDHLVLYAVELEAGSTLVVGTVQSLVDSGARAIVVVDRCDQETHEDLAGIVKRAGSRLSLVTIDHEYSTNEPPPRGDAHP